jgi:uncharacterized protein YecT (DUF1311 family)
VPLAAVAALAAGAGASAAPTPKPTCLKTAVAQAAMNRCAEIWLTRAEARLGTALAAYRRRFGASVVNASEAAWLAYRGAECRAQASLYRGGSVYPLVVLTCEKRLTDTRTAQIESDLASTPP